MHTCPFPPWPIHTYILLSTMPWTTLIFCNSWVYHALSHLSGLDLCCSLYMGHFLCDPLQLVHSSPSFSSHLRIEGLDGSSSRDPFWHLRSLSPYPNSFRSSGVLQWSCAGFQERTSLQLHQWHHDGCLKLVDKCYRWLGGICFGRARCWTPAYHCLDPSVVFP